MAAITYEPHGGIPTLERPRVPHPALAPVTDIRDHRRAAHSTRARKVRSAVLWRRRAVATLLALGMLVGAGRLVSVAGGALPVSDPAPSASSYVVEPGDTLWEVAERVAPGVDPRPVVDALADARGTSAVSPGETITWLSP